MLTLSNINLSLNHTHILQNISFGLKKGEILILRGDNGSGKSSLLSIIAGLLPPSSGQLENTFNTQLLFQDQNMHFIAPTVLDDICFSPMCKGVNAHKNAKNLLDIFAMNHLANAYISKLSEGQKKIIAFLGILISDANLLLLDEPTNHLDSKNKEKIFKLIDEDKRSFIISSHEKIKLTRPAREIYLP